MISCGDCSDFPATVKVLFFGRANNSDVVSFEGDDSTPKIGGPPDTSAQCFELHDLAVIDEQVYFPAKIFHISPGHDRMAASKMIFSKPKALANCAVEPMIPLFQRSLRVGSPEVARGFIFCRCRV
jgi:hypothetical protein